MKSLFQVVWGLFLALLAGGILLGSLAIAMIESEPELALLPPLQIANTASPTPLPLVDTPKPGEPTFTPTPTTLPPPTKVVRRHISPSPTPTQRCPPPAGWSVMMIEWGDTLAGLASRYGVPTDELANANCLQAHSLLPGTLLAVPDLRDPAVLVTKPALSCGPPSDWVYYNVQPEDTLYGLSISLGVTIRQLQIANCMGNSILITAGDRLAVPFIPISTTMPSPTHSSQSLPGSTATSPTDSTTLPTNLPSPTSLPIITPQSPSSKATLTPAYIVETTETAPLSPNPG